MSKFSDIKDGASVSTATTFGMVYTCNCGWIDLGHANPRSSIPTIGAANLWATINGETGTLSPNRLWHRVQLDMSMSKHLPLVGTVSDGISNTYAVRLGMTTAQKESVALSIFMRTSREFEALQSRFYYSVVTDSGFSGEDLISNLLGFYAAVRGTDFISICKPVSKSAAEAIWKTYGAPGSDANKNQFLAPNLYGCAECALSSGGAICGTLPAPFGSISEVPLGADYRVWDMSDTSLTASPPAPTAPAPTADKTVTVVQGVTLSAIAAAEYKDWRYWPLLYDVNKSVVGPNPNRLRLNITLRVPALESFSSQQRADAISRAPSWKLYPP